MGIPLILYTSMLFKRDNEERARDRNKERERGKRGVYIVHINHFPSPTPGNIFFSLTRAGGAGGGAKILKFSTLKDELGCAGERSPPRENFEAFNFKR